jgi:hypothetical protein
MSLLATHAEVVGAGILRAGAAAALQLDLRFLQEELAKLKQSVEHAGLALVVAERDEDVALVWLRMAGVGVSGLHLSLPTIVAALAAMVVVFDQRAEGVPVLALQESADS